MKVIDVVNKFGLKVFSGSGGLDREVRGGYVSDLLSDVMGHAQEGELWITLQTHRNVVAVASLKELAAIIVVNGLIPNEETIGQSDEEGIPILGTGEPAFDITGKLYAFLKA